MSTAISQLHQKCHQLVIGDVMMPSVIPHHLSLPFIVRLAFKLRWLTERLSSYPFNLHCYANASHHYSTSKQGKSPFNHCTGLHFKHPCIFLLHLLPSCIKTLLHCLLHCCKVSRNNMKNGPKNSTLLSMQTKWHWIWSHQSKQKETKKAITSDYKPYWKPHPNSIKGK